MQDLSAILYFLCFISTASIRINADEFNVLDYGAAGDGNADDSMVKAEILFVRYFAGLIVQIVFVNFPINIIQFWLF